MRLFGLFLVTATLMFAAEPAVIRAFDQATLEKLGVAIYEQDIRVARASDLLFAQKYDAAKEGLRGWIVEDDGKALLVRFVREREGKMEAFADIRFGPGVETKVERPADTTLSESQLARFRARELAGKNIKRPCSQRYNTVILPDPESDRLLVYALAATTDPKVILAGGHYRFTISKDGSKIEQADELFRSCLTVPKEQGVPKGSTPVAVWMTTLVSNMPQETHVFLSLLHRTPLVVGTPDRKAWHIEGGRMRAVDMPKL